MDKKTLIYKNDLKFNNDNNIYENSDFDSDVIKDIYNDYKKKPKIELRIKDSEMENYNYLDLSDLNLDDELLEKLINLDKIKNLLNKIKFLDLSSNNLKKFIDFSNYKNIIYLNIARNKIEGDIEDNNIIELSCEYNNIMSIKSKSIEKLNACNNKIINLVIPKLKIMLINNNNLELLEDQDKVEYLECMNNKLKNIGKFNKLKEIYIANNLIEDFDEMNELKVLNCINNPIKKIKYLGNLDLILCSTPKISSKYNIKNISKIKKDYLIKL